MGRGVRWGIGALIGAGLLAGIWARARRDGAGEAGEGGSYAGSISCRICHADAYEAWKASDHAQAQGPADPSHVRGRFEGERLEHFGTEARFERHDGAFFVRTEGADGRPGIFRVSEVIGVDPLQQYLVELDRGRLQTLPFCWDTRRGRWFHAYPDERIEAGDVLHWTRPAQTWNYMCADCHVTGYRKNYDAREAAYRSTYAERGVSCEACHGPSSAHVEGRRGRSLARLDSRAAVDLCGACHARRRPLREDARPGPQFLDHYAPELLDGSLYHPDGQVREEVYEYGSFLQSRMYLKGVRCTDCHDPHSARLKATGNNLCIRCHKPDVYDDPRHHHHPPRRPGSSCVDCHMPPSTFMVVDVRRDHGLRVPRPDLSVRLGVPNACTGCHRDRSAEWARDAVEAWFGPRRKEEPHFAEALAAGRARRPEGEGLLAALIERIEAAPILRASALALLRPYASGLPVSLRFLADPEPLVRWVAVRNLEEGPRRAPLEAVLKPLDDPVRLVRIEAARVFSALPAVREHPSFARAAAEFEESQRVLSDQWGAHHNLGVFYENLGRLDEAQACYETSLRLEPKAGPPRINLAMLHYRRGLRSEAERQLRRAVEETPDLPEAPYFLGLLLAEDERRLGEALGFLERACRQAPSWARARYNFGLALQKLGRLTEAETELREACRLDPSSRDAWHALYILLLQTDRRAEADAAAQALRRLSTRPPGDPGADPGHPAPQ